LPVYYVFEERKFEELSVLESCLSQIAPNGEQVFIFLGSEYQHLAGVSVSANVQLCSIRDKFLLPRIDDVDEPPGRNSFLGRRFPCSIDSLPDSALICYFGNCEKALLCLLIQFTGFNVFHFDPVSKSCNLASHSISRLMNRRFLAAEKAKEADIIGILVGTLAVGIFLLNYGFNNSLAQYRETIDKLREMITLTGKRALTVLVGKLNPAKLANFSEIPCFVIALRHLR
jgi:diphthamide biosynthesis protein 2